jgi:hypothetical protein
MSVTRPAVMVRCRCVRCGTRYLPVVGSVPDTAPDSDSTVLSVCGCCVGQLVLFPSLVSSLGAARVRDVRGRFVADTAAAAVAGRVGDEQ